MTGRPGKRRIVGVITPYHRLLDEAIGEDGNVSEIARIWGVPRYVLFDGLSEHAKRPSLEYAPLIAAGIGLSLETFLNKIKAVPVPHPVEVVT